MDNRRSVTGDDIINIDILTLDAQRYHLQVHQQILVGQLKEEIALLSGIPREHQLLLSNGRRLRDDRTLSDYTIRNGYTLSLVRQQPNAAPADLNPENDAPFSILFNGHGNAAYANQMLSALITGLVMNYTNNPYILPENPHVMTSLIVELNDLRMRLSQLGDGGFVITRFPSQQPLVDLLQSVSSVLNTILLTVYLLRFMIINQRSAPDMLEERIRHYAWILRNQLWHSSPYLFGLGNIMNDVIRQPAPNMPPPPPSPPPPPAMNFPTQPERRTRSRQDNGASSSNSHNNAAGSLSENLNASEDAEAAVSLLSQPERKRSGRARNYGVSSSNSDMNVGAFSQEQDASELVEDGNTHASLRQRDLRPSRRRRC